MLKAILIIATLIKGLHAQAKEQPKIDDIDKLQAIASSAEFIHKRTMEFYMKCFRSLGHPEFCECLKDNRKVIDFETYIESTSITKADLNYAIREAHVKSYIDTAISMRDKCVNKVWGTSKSKEQLL